jgi:hypothetical protein
MPGFARKYDAPCSSCHIAFPKLNSFGIEFKQRGYRMEDEGPGEPVWKLPGIPVGAVAQVAYESKDDPSAVPPVPSKTSRGDLQAVEFFFGGVLAPNVSFFGDFGAGLDANGDMESLTPDVAFVVFDDIVEDSLLNLKMGAIDVDFPFLSDPRSPTLSGYLARLGGEEGVTLGRKAVEINGYNSESKTRYALGIGNTDVDNSENNFEAIHAWVTQTFEMMGFEQSIGGILSINKNGDEALPTPTDDDTSAYGAVLDLHYGLSGLILAYYDYSGNDTLLENDVESGLAEVLHSFTEKVVGVVRYDYQDTDGTLEEKTQFTLGVQYFVHPNVKAQAEYSSLEDTDVGGVELETKTTTLALTVGF